MIDGSTATLLREWAEKYNRREYFREDPIAFPEFFAEKMKSGAAVLQDVEAVAVFAAHFAWGRRSMIVRDSRRLLDEMDWKPYDYVMRGQWRSGAESAHRTVRWSDVAAICARLKNYYEGRDSLEGLSQAEIRTLVYGQKPDPKAANKKINMLRRWMVRRDGRVDLGLWLNTDPAELLLPLDVHVHRVATELGLTSRKQSDATTVLEITSILRDVFPGDPCKGDFALFGYGVTREDRTCPRENKMGAEPDTAVIRTI